MSTLPRTSLDAYFALTPEKLRTDYGKIVKALQVLKEANYESIANQIGWVDKNAASRRLKELEGMGVIYKPGRKQNTSRNRSAYTYKLVENGEVSVQTEKVMQGETVSDISRKLVQKELF